MRWVEPIRGVVAVRDYSAVGGAALNDQVSQV